MSWLTGYFTLVHGLYYTYEMGLVQLHFESLWVLCVLDATKLEVISMQLKFTKSL